MMGLLGLLGWKVTVISSNFIALMLILTMAMNIHMSTRFLQLRKSNPSKSNLQILTLTTGKDVLAYTLYSTYDCNCLFIFNL